MNDYGLWLPPITDPYNDWRIDPRDLDCPSCGHEWRRHDVDDVEEVGTAECDLCDCVLADYPAFLDT